MAAHTMISEYLTPRISAMMKAAAPPGGFQHQCHQQGGHHHIHIAGPSGPFHDPQVIMPDIKGNHKGNGGQEPVKPAGLGPAGFFPHGIHQKTHHGHMEGPVDQGHRRPENGRVQMVQRNQDGKGDKKTPLQATGTFLFSNGDPPGIRTRDTLIKSQVLYQLS